MWRDHCQRGESCLIWKNLHQVLLSMIIIYTTMYWKATLFVNVSSPEQMLVSSTELKRQTRAYGSWINPDACWNLMFSENFVRIQVIILMYNLLMKQDIWLDTYGKFTIWITNDIGQLDEIYQVSFSAADQLNWQISNVLTDYMYNIHTMLWNITIHM